MALFSSAITTHITPSFLCLLLLPSCSLFCLVPCYHDLLFSKLCHLLPSAISIQQSHIYSSLSIAHRNLVFFDFAEPPQFIQKLPATTFVKLCEGLRFECKATSSHSLKMYWYKNDQKITEGNNYKIMLVDSTSYLQLHTTRFEDNGVYTCEAQNDAGCVSCSSVLTVQGQLC